MVIPWNTLISFLPIRLLQEMGWHEHSDNEEGYEPINWRRTQGVQDQVTTGEEKRFIWLI